MTQPPTQPAFWDRMARGYAEKPVPDEDAYQKTLERVRHYLRPGHQVLELGCGTGSTALTLAPCVRSLLATDYSKTMIEIAEAKRIAHAIDNLRLRIMTLDDPELDEARFDVVLAFNLIHLLDNNEQWLARVVSLIRPGGFFISKTPCIGEYNPLLRGVLPILRAFGRAPYVQPITKSSLENAIAETGLAIVETGLYPKKSHSLFVVAQKTVVP